MALRLEPTLLGWRTMWSFRKPNLAMMCFSRSVNSFVADPDFSSVNFPTLLLTESYQVISVRTSRPNFLACSAPNPLLHVRVFIALPALDIDEIKRFQPLSHVVLVLRGQCSASELGTLPEGLATRSLFILWGRSHFTAAAAAAARGLYFFTLIRWWWSG